MKKIVMTITLSIVLMLMVSSSVQSLNYVSKTTDNDPLVPYTIYGSATWSSGGPADGAYVYVVSEFGTLNTRVGKVSSGLWQVTCGDPEDDWPLNTEFVVSIIGDGLPSWQGWSAHTFSSVIGTHIDIGNIVVEPNKVPYKPDYCWGQHDVKLNRWTVFCAQVSDPNWEDTTQCRFDWGDGNFSEWSELAVQNEVFRIGHTWKQTGRFVVKVQAKDEHGAQSEWSEGYLVYVEDEQDENAPPIAPHSPNPQDDTQDINPESIMLSWECSDPEGDQIKYDVYVECFDQTPENLFVEQIDETHCLLSNLEKDTPYYWQVAAVDENGACQMSPVWSFSTICPEKVADLDCDGALFWSNVEPGSAIESSFTIENVGDPGSKLYWSIDVESDVGNWAISHDSVEYLTPADGPLSINVRCKLSEDVESNTVFEGYINVENLEDPSDVEVVEISIATQYEKTSFWSLLIDWLELAFPRLFAQ